MYIFRSIIRKFMSSKCLEMITFIASKNKKYMLACAGPESIVIHSNFFSIHIFRSMIRKRMSSKQCLEMITLITSKIKRYMSAYAGTETNGLAIFIEVAVQNTFNKDFRTFNKCNFNSSWSIYSRSVGSNQGSYP